ncbi:sporulation protein [Alteribacter lacisalsi]|uniref:Sporulation protein n=1 Tax=Alteribacter lacisalsi TaxID=2045244 RepID=A0A2W0HFR3_9BACI|nr:YhcN/YlaJ family sporulation lipoprotein [Alteribacter lacisalsi]PYZ95742.1 sporulation protein [Alteribacter lacisalsi]
MKRMIAASLLLTAALTACGGQMENLTSPYGQGQNQADGEGRWTSMGTGNTQEGYNVINREGRPGHDEFNRFGFVTETKESASEKEAPGYAVYDKELLADSISEMAAVIPDVNQCSTLVTDGEVLMVYDRDSDSNLSRDEVADQVRKTALSVIPSYYEVYVSDDLSLQEDIERFADLSPEDNAYEESLDHTIEQLKAYPQGEPISEDEMHSENNDYKMN